LGKAKQLHEAIQASSLKLEECGCSRYKGGSRIRTRYAAIHLDTTFAESIE